MPRFAGEWHLSFRQTLRVRIGLAALLALGALGTVGAAALAHAARDDLRRIVHQQCLPHWQRSQNPAPCLAMHLPSGAPVEAGYAVLADRKGGAHLLLIPLRALAGIESPELLQSVGLPNYFAAAWQAQPLLAARTARRLRRDDIALAINSRYSRAQDQLHIHVECQGSTLHAALLAHARTLVDTWQPLRLEDQTWLARRLSGASLAARDPLRLLAEEIPAAREHMAFYTLILAGMQYRDGAGFALLARRAVLRGGEALLDASCAVAAQPALR